ncbi:MAG: PASTA domain-containing protein [Planctomycetes bacterium]|nr:PASTA domain-containing protein [Planctomycetota bacterium]
MKSLSNLTMLLVTAIVILLVVPTYAQVYYVDGDNGEDPNNGLTWDTAKATIQGAVDAAVIDDEIWVKGGTYAIFSQIQVDKAVGIYGGFAGDETDRSQRDWVTNVTIVDGQNSTRIFKSADEPVIDGFSLINGYYDTSIGSLLGGGALYFGGFGSVDKTARISNCIISDNAVYADPIISEGFLGGGAIFVGAGMPIFTNCLITNNSTNAYGGAINIYSGSPDFINCTISQNIALSGGGLYLKGDGGVTIDADIYNCIIWGNAASDANDLKVISGGDDPHGSNNCSSVEIGSGTILADPLFINADNDFGLQIDSLCIDAGTDGITLADTDLEMNDRIIDGDNDTSPIVDIGAYEAPCRLYPPDVLEMTEADAETELNAFGLTKGIVTNSYSNTIAEGLVISQTPGTAMPVACTTAVDLVISDGLPLVSNDLCNGAIPVVAGGNNLGTTIDATGIIESTCGDNDTLDIWYSYTATDDGIVNITLTDSDFDTSLAVYDSCNTEVLACNDDFGHPDIDSRVALYMTDSTTYLIRVAGYDGQTGAFTLSIDDNPPGLDNDLCPNAIAIEPNEVYYGTTVSATGPDLSGCSYNDDIDVWHTFTPQTNVSAEITLCDSNFDTTLMIYDTCAGGTSLVSNDDSCGLQSRINVDLSTGRSYLIRVAGYDGETGDYALTINTVPIIVTADLDQSGVVGLGDLGMLGMHWQESEPWADVHPQGGDGIIDISDLIEIAIHWLETI